MDLSFTKQGDFYVATTSVNNDYNVHIELEDQGTVTVYHKTSGSEFAFVHNASGVVVMDDDFDGIIYPKTIKITTTKPVAKCIITEAA